MSYIVKFSRQFQKYFGIHKEIFQLLLAWLGTLFNLVHCEHQNIVFLFVFKNLQFWFVKIFECSAFIVNNVDHLSGTTCSFNFWCGKKSLMTNQNMKRVPRYGRLSTWDILAMASIPLYMWQGNPDWILYCIWIRNMIKLFSE